METARSRTEPAIPPEIRRAIAYMNSHLDHNMTLGQIAAKSGLSVYHFSRRFADVVRTSPMKYFLNRRLAETGVITVISINAAVVIINPDFIITPVVNKNRMIPIVIFTDKNILTIVSKTVR